MQPRGPRLARAPGCARPDLRSSSLSRSTSHRSSVAGRAAPRRQSASSPPPARCGARPARQTSCRSRCSPPRLRHPRTRRSGALGVAGAPAAGQGEASACTVLRQAAHPTSACWRRAEHAESTMLSRWWPSSARRSMSSRQRRARAVRRREPEGFGDDERVIGEVGLAQPPQSERDHVQRLLRGLRVRLADLRRRGRRRSGRPPPVCPPPPVTAHTWIMLG